MEIKIEKMNHEMFRVRVENERPTKHRVRVPAEDYEALTGGTSSYEELLQESFAFLLERESNSSILSEFSISDITRYFPEYPEDIKKRLKNS